MQELTKLPYFLAPPSYHETSYLRQQTDITRTAFEKADLARATCVVDVGCGAGQSLRIVEGLNEKALLIGIDVDESALAKGLSLGSPIQFMKAVGERLPLPDGTASHVICRVAINYMNHARALREMVRVLAPGGKLVLAFNTWMLSFEYLLSSDQGKRDRRLGNLKDLLAGLALQTLDLQAKPGTFWGRSTPYLSRAWLRRQLRKLNCEVTWLGRETCFLGMATVLWVIIAKRDTRSEN